MDFTYTDRMAELKARAADLAGKIMVFEDDCEQNNGLSDEAHATIRAAVLEAGLNAINHPTELGGAGLTILEQAVVQEELGKLTGALWDTVWRPANALRACTPQQQERWLKPGIMGNRRDAVAITEASAGSDPSKIKTTATRVGDRFVLNGEKWFVTVGDVADHFLVLAMLDATHRRCSSSTRTPLASSCCAPRATCTRSSSSTPSSRSTMSRSARRTSSARSVAATT